jgi:hypothetical protein
MPVLNIQAYYKIKLSFTFSFDHIMTQKFQKQNTHYNFHSSRKKSARLEKCSNDMADIKNMTGDGTAPAQLI